MFEFWWQILLLGHDPILVKSIGSKDRTWKKLTVQASPWYVVSCSMGLDLQKLQNFLAIGSKGEPQLKNDFPEVPPLVHGQKKLCSFWTSRPLEHVPIYYGEARTVKVFHVLSFDSIDFAKIGSCHIWNSSFLWKQSVTKSCYKWKLTIFIIFSYPGKLWSGASELIPSQC